MRALAAALTLFSAPAAAFECHTALVLALDASDSVVPSEADLQRRGIATALRDPEVRDAIAPAEGYGTMVMAFEWSDPGRVQVLARWTKLDGPEAIDALAYRFDNAVSAYLNGQTGLGAALDYAAEAHDNAPVACARRVIDVSGDGPGNVGATPDLYRSSGRFDGIIINGLVIRDEAEARERPSRDPLPYYDKFVKSGPGAFVMVTGRYEDYAEAMRVKLLRELRPSLAEAEE